MKTRKPTGVVPYPVVLLEGEEKAGKSYSAALLSASPKVGQTYWIDLGEGAADEYGVIPGARYLVVEHDGTYAQILQAVVDVKAEAAKAKAAGEPPVVLVIDSMSALWEGLKDWTTERAIARAKKKGKPADVENITITTDLWNDATARYRRLMTQLLTFPGIVVLTARGKEVAEMANGRPVEGSKTHKVEGHKSLAYDATVWVRMTRTAPPLVIGARSVHVGLIPGKDDPLPIDVQTPNLLEWLVFDAMKVDAHKAAVRELQHVTGGELTEDERAAEQGEQPKVPKRETRTRQPQQRVDEFSTSDQTWRREFEAELEKAQTKADMSAAWANKSAAVASGQVIPSDVAEVEALWIARRDVLFPPEVEGQAALVENTAEGWSDVTVAQVPA